MYQIELANKIGLDGKCIAANTAGWVMGGFNLRKTEWQEWEDPNITGINKEDGHVLAMPYDTLEGARESGYSPYKLSLNGTWKFKWVKGVSNRIGNFYESGYDDGPWDSIEVPGLWQLKGYGKPYYLAFRYPPGISTKKREIPKIDHGWNEIGFYRRNFKVPYTWDGREIFIHFGAVKSAFYLYINGKMAGFSKGSNNPSEFNITGYLIRGENTLAVEVYRYSDGTYLEDQDMWFFSGIYREVYLYAEPKVYIRDFFARCSMDKNYIDAVLLLDIDIKNCTDSDCSIKVGYTLTDGDGDVHQLLAEENITVEKCGDKNISLNSNIKSPKKWTAETPSLYTLILIIEDDKGNIIETKSARFGFRVVEIRDEQILINGKPIMIKGVNRHDFDPDTGWAVPRERYYQDLAIMKRSNINAIRTSHYPDDPLLYELCDRIGFYVLDEADMETHGVRRKDVPGNNPLWTKSVVDRMERMVLRDRNHPCIFMWSLGNEAGYGANFSRMKEAALKIDHTRPIHYEGDFDMSVSDVLSRMYPKVEMLDRLGNHQEIKISLIDRILNHYSEDNKPLKPGQYMGKPVLICEYAHSMENSLGNFQEYMDRFEKYKNMAGGFIWDFVDQSIHKSEGGVDKWLYGGDFGEEDTHRYFCANGIVSADRNPHPSIYEVKKVYQPVRVYPYDLDRGIIRVENKYVFKSLDEFEGSYEVLEDGIKISGGTIEDLNVRPGEIREYKIDYGIPNINRSLEYYLLVSFRIKEDAPWAQKGYEVAWDQFKLPFSDEKRTAEAAGRFGKIEAEDDGTRINIKGDNFSAFFSRTTGGIESLDYGYGELVVSPLVPNYWRALTDNDTGYANFEPKWEWLLVNRSWEKATLNRKVEKVDVKCGENFAAITVFQKVRNTKGRVVTVYRVYGDGSIYAEHTITPVKDMYRIGMTLALPHNFHFVRWYGRGPQETYSDRKSGAKVGIYSKKVDDMVHNYMRPQENGNRTDVRWAEITDINGKGIRVEGGSGQLLNISTWPYSMQDLEKANHIYELPERNFNTLNIDYMQKGVGGDFPGVAMVHDRYLIKKGRTYKYSFIIRNIEK